MDKKKYLAKILRKKFFPFIFYQLAIVMLFLITIEIFFYKNYDYIIPVIINYLIIIGIIITVIWSYKRRINATAFLICETAYIIMITLVFLSIQILVFEDINKYYISITFSLIIIISLFFLGLKHEIKNWLEREQLWLSDKKLNINKAYYNILIYPGNLKKDGKYIYSNYY